MKDLEKLREYSRTVSSEIRDDYADDFDSKSRDLDEDEFSPENLFDYFNSERESNGETVDEFIKEYSWRSMTQELGLA